MNVLIVSADPERQGALARALRTGGFTVLAVGSIAEIERWPRGDLVVTEWRWFSGLWAEVGAAHVIVLAETPADGADARRRGATAWLSSECSAEELLIALLKLPITLGPVPDPVDGGGETLPDTGCR